VVTIRVNGASEEIPSGETFSLGRLRDPRATNAPSRRGVAHAAVAVQEEHDMTLRAATDRLTAEFHTAVEARDAEGAARAALGLEESLRLWSADTLQSDDADYARTALRGMITRLADLAVTGLRDPRESIAPVMEVLLDLRARVRADKRFDLSDVLRDRLADLGIEVRDTPNGATWNLRA
jgi:cysteinyl-tRNA synthetase